jgi:hypothetical protein
MKFTLPQFFYNVAVQSVNMKYGMQKSRGLNLYGRYFAGSAASNPGVI